MSSYIVRTKITKSDSSGQFLAPLLTFRTRIHTPMPRTKQDYAVRLRQDLAHIDEQMHALAIRRVKLARMLHDYESTLDSDEVIVSNILRAVLQDTEVSENPKKPKRR